MNIIENMFELIIILCLIWNVVYLISSRQYSYVSGWSDYTFKFAYSRGEGKDAWGFSQLLIVPKCDSRTREIIDEIMIEQSSGVTQA